MKISFVIVNYRSEKYLKNCINSIFNKVKGVEFEVIIVNNDKRKIEPSVFKENQVYVKEIGKNIGFGAACNKGSMSAKGEILCFINPDVKIVSENINEIIDKFEKNQYIGVISPKILEDNFTVQPWSAGFKPTIAELVMNNLGLTRSRKIWESEIETEADWVTGATMFIRKDLFDTIGGFDEGFFMYFEDLDLCLRIKNKDLKILYFPSFSVIHKGGVSASNKLEQKKQYYSSQDYYFQKHFSKLHKRIIIFLRYFHK